MLEAKDREIGGKNYRVTPLPTKRGRRMLVTLFRVGGPGLAEMFSADGSTEVSLKNLAAGKLGDVISKLAASIDEKTFEWIFQEFAEHTEVETDEGGWRKLSSEFDFVADYKAMFQWLGFCLEINFGNFLDD